jgi:L-histidine N-alpha-methyltransferase
MRAEVISSFASDVEAGLCTRGQKSIPCQYLYDAAGSALFEAITLLPEYGLTRAEERILFRCAGEVARKLRYPRITAELGSGSGQKSRILLEALAAGGRPAYYPIDVSPCALERCRCSLQETADVRPVRAEYLDGLKRALAPRAARSPVLVLFLGSTIGNFDRISAEQFLRKIHSALLPGDALLLGADLDKPERDLLLAYDDPAGVTAAFNLNLLSRINRELGGDFVLRNFAHEARFNREERRVEMHLRSRVRQRVRVKQAGLEADLEAGETIWTESSYRFELQEIRQMANRAGFTCTDQWADAEWPFSESLLLR